MSLHHADHPTRHSGGSLRQSIASIASFPEFVDDDSLDGDGDGSRSTRSRASTRLLNRTMSMSSVGSEFLTGEYVEGDNSLTVITSLWSTMMGSTVLVMPKMFRDAGLIGGLFAIIFMCLLCAYTAVTISRLGRIHGMTTKEVVFSLPHRVALFTLVMAVLMLVGAGMLFHVYLVECLMTIIGKPQEDTSWRLIVAFGCGVVVYLLTVPRSIRLLFVASSYGIVIVGFCLIFIVIKSVLQMRAHDCEPLLNQRFGMSIEGFTPVALLMSTLTLSFYSHSFVLPLVAQSTRMSKVPRNVFIAYLCAGSSYLVPSMLATIAFSNCGTFSSDFVQMFSDPFADAARFSIILLVLIVYPIIICIARGQFIETFWNIEATDASWCVHCTTSAVMILIATSIPAMNVAPTTVAASAGVIGTYWALILPAAAYLYTRQAQGTLTRPLVIGQGLIIFVGITLIVITVLSVAGVLPAPAGPDIPSPPNVTHAPHHNMSAVGGLRLVLPPQVMGQAPLSAP